MSDVRVHVSEDVHRPEVIRRFVEQAFDWDRLLGELPTQTARGVLIVVKPNWVQESHEYKKDVWEPVITSPELLLSVVEYVAFRMAGRRATICICDAPHSYADFGAIVSRGQFGARLASLAAKHSDVRFELRDLRRTVDVRREEVVVQRRQLPEDPRGYVTANLGEDSLFYGHLGEGRYYGADHDSGVVNVHHRGHVQEYLISGTAIQCDLFINLPKLKTHKKTGITCCLKNLVGINGEKNWLPHHTEGFPGSHGDEFPRNSVLNRIEAMAKDVAARLLLDVPLFGTWIYRKTRNAGKGLLGDSQNVVRNGNWSGNDTCWRMALDLNRALLYCNPDGSWRDRFHAKAYLAIVDGIIGGQGNGPLCPDPIQSNTLISGTNPGEVDSVAAKLMGFDPDRVPLIRQAFEPHRWPITLQPMNAVTAFDSRMGCSVPLSRVAPAVPGGFMPHFGWTDVADRHDNYGVHR